MASAAVWGLTEQSSSCSFGRSQTFCRLSLLRFAAIVSLPCAKVKVYCEISFRISVFLYFFCCHFPVFHCDFFTFSWPSIWLLERVKRAVNFRGCSRRSYCDSILQLLLLFLQYILTALRGSVGMCVCLCVCRRVCRWKDLCSNCFCAKSTKTVRSTQAQWVNLASYLAEVKSILPLHSIALNYVVCCSLHSPFCAQLMQFVPLCSSCCKFRTFAHVYRALRNQ